MFAFEFGLIDLQGARFLGKNSRLYHKLYSQHKCSFNRIVTKGGCTMGSTLQFGFAKVMV